MTDAAMGCVCLHPRKAYNDNVGQCVVWALTTESFKDEVLRVAGGEQLMVKWPLNQYMVVNFIALLEKKQVPWTYTNKKTPGSQHNWPLLFGIQGHVRNSRGSSFGRPRQFLF